MGAQILNGKKVAAIIRAQLAAKIQARLQKGLCRPGLAVIQVGTDPASSIYVKNKRIACEQVGIHSEAYDLPENTKQEELCALINQLNHNKNIHGVLVQLPLPAHIDSHLIIERIDPSKDVDGFHPYNMGRLAQRRPLLRPCTPYGIITLLGHAQINLSGLNAVIVGASNIVGRPMALELLLANSTVTICHQKTQNLAQHIANADLLIVAIGHPGIIRSEWIKPNAIVIDVGINRGENGQLRGDIDFASAKQKASWITPVPGGVGPMTVSMLLHNTFCSAENLQQAPPLA